jgi:hypothetical protein
MHDEGLRACKPVADSEHPPSTPGYRNYSIRICDQCYRLEGEMCHNPKCVFCRRTMQEVGEMLDALLIRPVVGGERLDLHPRDVLKVGDLIDLGCGRIVRVADARDGSVARDHRGRIAVRNAATNRLSYIPEQRLKAYGVECVSSGDNHA